MKLWGKLVCAVTRKHKRGKLVQQERYVEVPATARTPAFMAHDVRVEEVDVLGGKKHYACPRCGAQWTRKARNASV